MAAVEEREAKVRVALLAGGRSTARCELVVVHEDGTGELWPASLTEWKHHACAVAGRNFTHEEWRRYVGNRPCAATCQ